MKIKSLTFSILFSTLLFAFTSCEKDDSAKDNPGNPDTTPFAMVYQDFITPDDVQIISPDTTTITVSTAYAEKMGIKEFNNRAVSIWRTIGTIPFIRIIKDAQYSKDKITLTTVRGELSDLFSDIDLKLESDLHINRNFQPTKTTRAGTNYEVDDISGKYMDEEGVLHPAVIIFEEESPVAKSLKTKTGTSKNYFTAEELLEDNITFNLISLNSDFVVDLHYPNDSTSRTSVHLIGKVGAQAQLSAFLNLSIGFFKITNFEAGLRGDASLAAKLALAVNYKLKKEWEETLFNFGKTSMVFWAGIFPVPCTINTKLKQETTAEANATAEALATLKYSLGFECGCRYTNSAGWSTIGEGGRSSKDFKFDGVKGTASAEFSAGVFFESGIYLFDCAGPTLSIGPKVGAEAEISATVSEDKINVDASCEAYAGLGAEIGAELKVFSYKLAKWSSSIDLFKLILFQGSFSMEYTEEGWDKIAAEWEAGLNSGSWETANLGISVPYRLPDQEINI